MNRFPSKLEFGSYLQYSPQGSSEVSKYSRDACSALKTDGLFQGHRFIDEVARRIASRLEEYPVLSEVFGSDTILVPVPRSAPLRDKSGLWPTLRICQALVNAGLGYDVEPCLKRVSPVQKSSVAAPGMRPGPLEHFSSTTLEQSFGLKSGRPVTVVDDIITRGSSFVGMVPHFLQQGDVKCFAVIRTMSNVDISKLLDPVKGQISFENDRLKRRP